MKIGICAPSATFARKDAMRLTRLAEQDYPHAGLIFHDQCFESDGHFAGSHESRAAALISLANNPDINAIWFARGGYGACHIAEEVIAGLTDPAHGKIYMGYSDQGNLLGALYKAGIGRPVHGPMPADVGRDGGEAAVRRALDWMISGDTAALEGGISANNETPPAAFNLMTLAMMVGTPNMPDLSGHILLIEEVSEYLYAVDRAMFNVTSHLSGANLAGIRLGRVSDVPDNDRPFGQTAEEIARHWCNKNSIPYLGRADIGHDADNKIVPFGLI